MKQIDAKMMKIDIVNFGEKILSPKLNPQAMLNPTLGSPEPAQKQDLPLHCQQKSGAIHFCNSPSQYWTSTVELSHFDGTNLNVSTRT